MKINNLLKLIIAILVAELAGVIGSIFTVTAIPIWYAALAKPALNPPNWVFAPVWSALFVLMGVAAFLVWRQGLDKKAVRIALIIFLGQLALNSLWSMIFFGLHNPGTAFLEIIILWLAILATIFFFYKVSRPAAYLLIPYILWVSFAGYLNFSIWRSSVKTGDLNVGTACTMEAKICPDGSGVGRSGPNCEFTPCPDAKTDSIPAGWLTFTDPVLQLSFNYPIELTTEYTSTVNWPPKISISSDPWVCPDTAPASSLPERTSRRLVDNRVYCLKAVSEGAAGSVFTNYTYTTEEGSKLVIIEFTLRAGQCYNYDDPQKTACERERETFDLDVVVNRMVESLKCASC